MGSTMSEITEEMAKSETKNADTEKDVLERSAKAQLAAEKEDAAVDVTEDVEEKEKKYRVILHEQQNTDNSHQQFFGVNGKSYLLRRGEEATIPASVLEILRNSIYTFIDKNPETGDETERKVPRFSFTVLGEAI